MTEDSKRTSLYDNHVANEAKMGNFGGYDMPLWYPSGPKKEHLAVIQKAGIFDTSHMAMIILSGPGTFELLQHCFSKDLSACIGPKKAPLQIGKCVYGVFLNEEGHVIDDALVYQVGDQLYSLVVNAGMGTTLTNHLKKHSSSADVTLQDMTDKLGKIDVQGPMAAKILREIIQKPDVVLEQLPYFNFKGYFSEEAAAITDVRLSNGTPILLSRTGYTGEFGFEIFIDSSQTEVLWKMLKEAGEAYGVLSCGLAARDSLRAGAVLPLSHQDIGNWPFLHHPWPFALAYNESSTGFVKEFIGSQALLQTEYKEHTYPFSGFDPRKVIPGPDTTVVDESDQIIGSVLSCATDMAIDRHEGAIISIASPDCPTDKKIRGLSCGFIKTTQKLKTGDRVYLKGNNRKFEIEICDDIRPARTARTALKKML